MAFGMQPRGSAADKLLASMGGMEDMPPMPEGEEEMMTDEASLAGEEAGADSLEAAIAGVDAAIEGLPEATAREIRTHLEAIRDIASREPEAPEMPEDAGGLDEPMPTDAPPPSPMGEEKLA